MNNKIRVAAASVLAIAGLAVAAISIREANAAPLNVCQCNGWPCQMQCAGRISPFMAVNTEGKTVNGVKILGVEVVGTNGLASVWGLNSLNQRVTTCHAYESGGDTASTYDTDGCESAVAHNVYVW